MEYSAWSRRGRSSNSLQQGLVLFSIFVIQVAVECSILGGLSESGPSGCGVALSWSAGHGLGMYCETGPAEFLIYHVRVIL